MGGQLKAAIECEFGDTYKCIGKCRLYFKFKTDLDFVWAKVPRLFIDDFDCNWILRSAPLN